jgi:hypothetical protein
MFVKLVALTFVAFLVLLIALRQFHSSGILLYQGIALGCFVSVAHYVVARYRAQSIHTATKDAVFSFLLSYAFVFTVPAVVDGSASVKMMHHLFNAPDGLTREDMARFYAEDATNRREIDRRLEEQTDVGMITRQDGRYTLTGKGRLVSQTFSAAEVLFDCNQ